MNPQVSVPENMTLLLFIQWFIRNGFANDTLPPAEVSADEGA